MRNVLAGEEASLVKADGSTIQLVVQFSRGSAMTFDVATAIEPGDIFVRRLPNGAVERFEVVDPGYHPKFGSIAANYQCKIQRVTSEMPPRNSREGTATSGVFVVHGRDEAVREDIYKFLRVVGLKVITWGDAVGLGKGSQTNAQIVRQGIESAQAVIVLFTPDEIAGLRPDLDDTGGRRRRQPRPNVLFEAGWAFGAHQAKTIVVEVGMTHHVSDIDGFNNVRMRDAASLNDLAARLETVGLEVNRNDPSWVDPTKYPALFGPRLPDPEAEDPSGPPAKPTRSGLDDDTLVQLLDDELPEPGFYLYDALDLLWGTEPGTAKRLAARAAKRRDRLEETTEHGIRFGSHVIQRSRRRFR